jgi:hypothetical protein
VKKRDKRHILLAIPTETSQLHVPVAAFAVEATKYNQKRGCPFQFSTAFLVGKSPTEYARNCLITQAVKQKDVDAIWFVDSDMVPSPNSFQLLNIKADIVAGIAPILTNTESDRPSFTWNLYKRVVGTSERDFIPIGLNGGKPMQVDGVGTACMIISRKVFTDKRLWLGKPVGDDKIIPLFQWPRNIAGETLGTDDLDFCRRARDLGYTITVDPSVKWGHLKELDLKWPIEKLNLQWQRPPSSLVTMNEYNDYAIQVGQPPQFVYQLNPSGEATQHGAADGVNRANRE